MGRRFLFRLPNEIDKLMLLAAEIRELPEYRRLDGKSRYALDLAIEEMAGNIIRYGYDVPGERVIEIGIEFADEDVTLTLRDDGRPFNPLAADPPPAGGVEERDIGGVGVYLVRSMVRSMEYRREGGRNVLTLRIGREREQG
ncbi:MAG: ATP-binding protein [Lentisphaeria bacterium]|nr:ATP-binding protein [Lentisphaeria bacterium]